MDSFTVESLITATTFAGRCNQGDVLVCRREDRNRHDPFAVTTCKIVGYVRSLNNTVRETFTVLNENKSL